MAKKSFSESFEREPLFWHQFSTLESCLGSIETLVAVLSFAGECLGGSLCSFSSFWITAFLTSSDFFSESLLVSLCSSFLCSSFLGSSLFCSSLLGDLSATGLWLVS